MDRALSYARMDALKGQILPDSQAIKYYTEQDILDLTQKLTLGRLSAGLLVR